ncbi:hypothetical protein FKM82_005877 [Ascaphus truei]
MSRVHATSSASHFSGGCPASCWRCCCCCCLGAWAGESRTVLHLPWLMGENSDCTISLCSFKHREQQAHRTWLACPWLGDLKDRWRVEML